jgi:hypothetical protein
VVHVACVWKINVYRILVKMMPTRECACRCNDNIEMKVTGDVTPSSLVDYHQYFKGTSCPAIVWQRI